VDSEVEDGGRIRLWGFILEIGYFMRVVVLSDGRTVHNAFIDKGYNGPG
jgi:hypothetical protein